MADLADIRLAVTAPFIVLWLMAAVALFNAEPAARADLVLGNTWPTCVPEIVLLALPTFVATFWAMRGLAPTRSHWPGPRLG